MRLKVTALAALAAFSLTAADTPKPEPKTPPAIATAKIWRLIAQAQAARQQLNDSPAGKAAAKAEEAVQEAQAELAKTCGDKFALGYGPDGDLACVVVKAEPEPAKPAEQKGK